MNLKKSLFYFTIFAIGLLIGYFGFSGNSKHNHLNTDNQENQIWTCSMHPQIRQDSFGRCPLCAMDLIPVRAGASDDPEAIQLSLEAIALANIHTTRVTRSRPVKELHLFGTVMPNQRLVRSQSSHVNGRIESLLVSTVGESIVLGQTIATIFSPDLLNAQQELIEAKRLENIQPALLNAAREKLRLWNLSDQQIKDIELTGVVSPIINLNATVEGIITNRYFGHGDYVSVGSVLFDLIDLSSVWTVFNAFEADLPYLRTGDLVEYTLPSIPGRSFSGRISFIEPILDQNTRTAMIRVETNNPRNELKPGMFANAVISSTLRDRGEVIVVPRTAVLWTGRRSIVYVKVPNEDIPTFKLREIMLGTSLGDDFVVLAGLFDDEEVVTRGAFVIDASAQLEGRRSMMNLADDTSKETIAIEQTTLIVQGLCSMCKDIIETAANNVQGVAVAIWNPDNNILRLNFNPNITNLNQIARAIANVGYDNERFKANDDVYNALHECCLYREIDESIKQTTIENIAINTITTSTLIVQGNCNMCKNLIERTVLNLNGVSEASWNSISKELKMTYDANFINIEAIARNIADIGYDNEIFTAEDDVYNALHSCCLYR